MTFILEMTRERPKKNNACACLRNSTTITIWIIVTFLLISCGTYKDLQSNIKLDVDEVYKSWNSSTYKSIAFQAKSSVDSKKQEYDEQLQAFQVQQGIKSLDDVTANSIRYKFLRRLSTQYLRISDFFIVEADISGEYYQPRIFVLYSRNKKSTDVMKFAYNKNEWEFVDSFLLPYQYRYDYKEYIAKGNGDWNRHKIIVSHILNNHVERSDFFLEGTMQKFVFELPESANHF